MGRGSEESSGTNTDSEHEVIHARGNMVGMPSMRHYTLTANKVGVCIWRMVRARSWEYEEDHDKGVATTFKITVVE